MNGQQLVGELRYYQLRMGEENHLSQSETVTYISHWMKNDKKHILAIDFSD